MLLIPTVNHLCGQELHLFCVFCVFFSSMFVGYSFVHVQTNTAYSFVWFFYFFPSDGFQLHCPVAEAKETSVFSTFHRWKCVFILLFFILFVSFISLYSELSWLTAWAGCKAAIKRALAKPPGVLLALHTHTHAHTQRRTKMFLHLLGIACTSVDKHYYKKLQVRNKHTLTNNPDIFCFYFYVTLFTKFSLIFQRSKSSNIYTELGKGSGIYLEYLLLNGFI